MTSTSLPSKAPWAPSSARATRRAETRRAALARALGPREIDAGAVLAAGERLEGGPTTRSQAEHVLAEWVRRGFAESVAYGIYRLTAAGRSHYAVGEAPAAPVAVALAELRLGRKGDAFRQRRDRFDAVRHVSGRRSGR